MKRIFYIYRTKRGRILERIKRKKEPNHYLYGMNYLRKNGYKVAFTDLAFSPLNLFHLLFYPLEHLLIKLTSVGFKLDQAITLMFKLKSSEAIITTADSAGLPVLLLKKIKLINKPVIYISTGLMNELYLRRDSIISKFYLSILKESDMFIFHSQVEKRIFEKLITGFSRRIKVLPFGIDSKYFACSKKSEKYILSVGRDKSRDFRLLSKVAKDFPKEQFLVVTSKSNIKDIVFPKNVQVLYDLSYERVKDLYSNAKLVFLPLNEINRASGQVSFLESLASGNKIVTSRVRGLVEPYDEIMKKDKNVYLFKPGEKTNAVKSLKRALRAKRIESKFPHSYDSENYGKRLADILRGVINDNKT